MNIQQSSIISSSIISNMGPLWFNIIIKSNLNSINDVNSRWLLVCTHCLCTECTVEAFAMHT